MQSRILAVVVVALSLTVVGCRETPTPAVKNPRPSQSLEFTQSLGIGLSTGPDGIATATGVLGRYPVMASPQTTVEAAMSSWVLFAHLGTRTSAPVILAYLGEGIDAQGRPVPADPRFVELEGKLVTATGRYEGNGFSEVTSIGEVQGVTGSRLASLGDVVKPGEWWTKWGSGYLTFWEKQQYGTAYPTLDVARPRLSFAPVLPDSSLLGERLGIFVDDISGPEYRGAVIVYSGGFTLGVTPAAVAGDSFPELDKTELGKIHQGAGPPYPSAVEIAGHPGALQGVGKLVTQLSWRDGQAVYVLMFAGGDDAAPSGEQMVQIAQSAYN